MSSLFTKLNGWQSICVFTMTRACNQYAMNITTKKMCHSTISMSTTKYAIRHIARSSQMHYHRLIWCCNRMHLNVCIFFLACSCLPVIWWFQFVTFSPPHPNWLPLENVLFTLTNFHSIRVWKLTYTNLRCFWLSYVLV